MNGQSESSKFFSTRFKSVFVILIVIVIIAMVLAIARARKTTPESSASTTFNVLVTQGFSQPGINHINVIKDDETGQEYLVFSHGAGLCVVKREPKQ